MRLLLTTALTAVLWADGAVPRKSAADYPAHGELPTFSMGGEYLAHSVPGEGHTIVVEDYLVVELGLFPTGAPIKIPPAGFSLRINSAKRVVPPQPPEMVGASLQNWMMPPQQRQPSNDQQVPASLPHELVVAMALPQVETVKPIAGYLYFAFRGKLKSVRTLELLYHGQEGDTVLKLK